ENHFREDLFYRLAGVVINLPPLRERGPDDIAQLVQYFLARFGAECGQPAPALETAALGLLQEQPWPGNVRQLANVIRQALLLAGTFPVGVQHVESALRGGASVAEPELGSFESAVERILQSA